MIKIKKKGGHVIYRPLSATFQMQELGGSSQQKFDATTGRWKPNRILTPYLLRPQLLIQDPEGILPTGDYSSDLVNVAWTAKSLLNSVETNLTPGTDYVLDNATKSLTLMYNVAVDEVVTITFYAQYVDPRRADMNALTFKWSTQVTTEAEADYKVTLDTGQWNSKILISPFKNWGRFAIPVQLKDGDDAIADARCTYQWQWWTGTAWSEDFSERFWYVSGATSKQIQLDADFIQDITLRVKAIAYGDTTHPLYFATRLLKLGALESPRRPPLPPRVRGAQAAGQGLEGCRGRHHESCTVLRHGALLCRRQRGTGSRGLRRGGDHRARRPAER